MESSRLGLILDSSVLIAGERRSKTVKEVLRSVHSITGDQEIGLSVITIAELTHGIYRAQNEGIRSRREAFVDELVRDIPVYPLTLEAARIAGRLEGTQASKGIVIPMEDLFIGATALHQRFGVATLNVRHFQLIPHLHVVQYV